MQKKKKQNWFQGRKCHQPQGDYAFCISGQTRQPWLLQRTFQEFSHCFQKPGLDLYRPDKHHYSLFKPKTHNWTYCVGSPLGRNLQTSIFARQTAGFCPIGHTASIVKIKVTISFAEGLDLPFCNPISQIFHTISMVN